MSDLIDDGKVYRSYRFGIIKLFDLSIKIDPELERTAHMRTNEI